MNNPLGYKMFEGEAVLIERDADGGVNDCLTHMVKCVGQVKVLKSENGPGACYVYLIVGDVLNPIMEIKFDAMEAVG